ncbi:MAG: hypothetical protein IJD59_04335, partial [Clostridia bacterium]|nr:hypothetical protein [Clostridia bacterium]
FALQIRVHLRRVRRDSRYFAPIRTSDQTARLFASFCNFFFQTKKKLTVSPYQREKLMKITPSADKEKASVLL